MYIIQNIILNQPARHRCKAVCWFGYFLGQLMAGGHCDGVDVSKHVYSFVTHLLLLFSSGTVLVVGSHY